MPSVGSISPSAGSNQYFEVDSTTTLINTAENACNADTNVLSPKNRESAQRALNRDVAQIRSTAQKMRESGISNGEIFLKINPLIDGLLITNAKRISDFQNYERNQSSEVQKAREVFSTIADLMLPGP
jgi:hypothetical protein